MPKLIAHRTSVSTHTISVVALLTATTASALAEPSKVWFAKAGGKGDGTSAVSPIGETEELERVTKPGDVIMLLSGEEPLQGGLALKKRQALIGLAVAGRKPTITNATADRNDGQGIVLADGNRVWSIRVEKTFTRERT